VHWGNDSNRMHLQESIRLSVVLIILSLKISSGLTGAEVDTADALHLKHFGSRKHRPEVFSNIILEKKIVAKKQKQFDSFV